MNIHYLQHVPFEGPGSIKQWAIAHGHQLSYTRLYAGDHLPALDRFDMLVVLGGPMSIHDEFDYVWLKAEKWFIRQVIDAGMPVLGICLGAQLIAEILGARVHPGREKEIGWFPVTLDDAFATTRLGQSLPETMEVFHWHGETFTLPEGATRIASSVGCENQGFLFGDRVIALQFHLETTPASAEEIVVNSRDELVDGPYIQDEADILTNEERYAGINDLMQTILYYLEMQAT